MKYYISVDSGGTKLQAILYDDTFHIVNSARMSGTNAVFRSSDQMIRELEQLTEELVPAYVTELGGVDMNLPVYGQEFLVILNRRCMVRDCCIRKEAHMILASAGVSFGIVAQSGTGSDAFLIQPNLQTCIGGWGFVLGDEGSGYDIGLQTLKAAIYAYEGRGPKTAILDILMDEWKLSVLRDLPGKLSRNLDYKRLVASATGITVKAAGQNDAVALAIYEQAGHDIARLVLMALEQARGEWEGPIIASGGAWKGCGRMFDSFCSDIRSQYPDAKIAYPIFEPVAGGAVLRWFDMGNPYDIFKDNIQNGFQSFLYGK